MGIRDILAKLGILRYGTKKAVYHSGKDMPAEFLMNDVFDAKHDLTTIQDLKKAKSAIASALGSKPEQAADFCAKCGTPRLPDQKFCPKCGAEF